MMNQEKKNRPCFETEMGSPAITFESGGKRLMLPYSSFEGAKQEKNGSISILFVDWIIELRGRVPEELWSKLQLFDISVLRVSEEPDEDKCSIDHLAIHTREGRS